MVPGLDRVRLRDRAVRAKLRWLVDVGLELVHREILRREGLRLGSLNEVGPHLEVGPKAVDELEEDEIG